MTEIHHQIAAKLAAGFRERFGRPPEGVWQAPGRVNLIGDHTDYNAGLALPFAIDRSVVAAIARRPDRVVRVWSAQVRGAEAFEAHIGHLFPRSVSGWAAYPLGVLWAFGQASFEVGGLDLAVDSTLPVGGGLSASAALLAAVARGVDELGRLGAELVEICHRAEVDFVGAPVGLLDHLAVARGRSGHGLLIDFADGRVEHLPLALGPLAVVNTGVAHRTASGEYATRRRQCQEAAARLGLATLREATPAAVEKRLDGVVRRRARHVVSENQRVLEVARRLRADASADLGDILFASHASLRDDFEVSGPELDAVVSAAGEAGAQGARLTGAGFGGCAIVVGLDAATLDEALARRGLLFRPAFEVIPSGGGGRVA